jgi:hypothetical protein
MLRPIGAKDTKKGNAMTSPFKLRWVMLSTCALFSGSGVVGAD